MKTIPVVIVNWNGLNDTLACVDSVLAQSHTQFKVYVVDNASDNNEFEALEQRYAKNVKVKLMHNSENIGFGAAHNRVFDQLINEGFSKVALLNNDALADVDWLGESLAAMERECADVVACKMLQYAHQNLVDSVGLKMLNTGEILPRGHGDVSTLYTKSERVMGFCAGACLINLSVIHEIGGFDSFFDTGYEDADLSLRTFVAEKKIVSEPRAIVFHKMGQSLGKVKSYKRTLKILRDINYTALVNLPLAVLLVNFPFYVLRNFMLILVFVFSFRFRYLLYFFHGLTLTIFIDSKYILKSRKGVHRKIGVGKMLRAQTFFLKHDIMRFSLYIVNCKPHKFEQ